MPRFVFVVEGPPVSVNTKNTAKLAKWKDKVRKATGDAWLAKTPPVDNDAFEVSITNYYRASKDRPNPPDVDNIVKPILDGVKTVVFEDDNRVSQIVSNRFDLANGLSGVEPELVAAAGTFDEFLYIQIRWNEE